MELAQIEMLPTAQQMALAYLGKAERAKLAPAFALDFRLSRIAWAATEPVLAQMRIAWWRDMLVKPIAERPRGDPVLARITENWQGAETALFKLVDAWEEFLLAEKLDRDIANRIAQGRGAILAEIMRSPGEFAHEESAEILAVRWALADMAAHCSADEERELLVQVASEHSLKRTPLPRNLRGIAVLDALSRHALKCGGRPLAEGRAGALVAFRAGLFGR